MAVGASVSAGIYLFGADCMKPLINVGSSRGQQARLANLIGKAGYRALLTLAVVALVGGLALFTRDTKNLAYLLLALAVLFYMPAAWWKRQLSVLPAQGSDLNDRLSGDTLARLKG